MTEQDEKQTWVGAVEQFILEAGDLSDAFAPQLLVLRTYAEQIDAAIRADEDPSIVLIGEYARIHRWLVNKRGGAKGSSSPEGDEASILDMFKSNPGVVWRAD